MHIEAGGFFLFVHSRKEVFEYGHSREEREKSGTRLHGLHPDSCFGLRLRLDDRGI